MSSREVVTYSPKDVSLIISGYKVAGWDEISIVRNGGGFIPVQGIRGKHTRVTNPDTSANISLTIIQTSASNEVLSSIHGQDLVNGTGRLVVTLKDLSGRSVFSSDEAYILTYPEAVFSGDFEYRAWSIRCQTTKSYVIGGNDKPQTSIFDGAINAASDFINSVL